MRIAAAALIALAFTACTKEGNLKLGGEEVIETRWRMITTDQDRERLRNWRKAWVEALPKARAADAAAIAAEGALFEHDQALGRAMPPAGDYKCRAFKLGGQREGMRDFTAYPWFNCRIGREGEMPTFVKLDGSQRPTGKIYAETDARVIFLGALELGDETIALDYGRDVKRDLAGYIERVGTTRWRLVLPWPTFESQLDVIELVPA
ncbi:DUF4893 domain-containing protein [Sphingomonas sp. BT-65]|uniref:DUF4893 domain-containing protein n=1 Tax=Sphingomonas sp. BT-65 TaxID=2989821 RepID=UPI002235ED76|nr:DUF4893 domain-containing protein [Sphingomonas sp. BT-65]MCW4462883.1 DUF4893 domain-containing protein [Sphingomonas sp. BT-65]